MKHEADTSNALLTPTVLSTRKFMSLRRQDASDDDDQSGQEEEFFTDSDSPIAGDEGRRAKLPSKSPQLDTCFGEDAHMRTVSYCIS